jgi:hypothetical protein
LPEEDCAYLGSFYDKTFAPTEKIIIDKFKSREQALQAEIDLHSFYQVHKNAHFANKAMQTSTKFVSNGEGMRACLEKYPNFNSDAGKIGGRVTQERHPELASQIGKKAVVKLRQWHKDNPELSRLANQKAAVNGAAYFKSNPEAAKKRGANGVKAMQAYWDKVGYPCKKGENGTCISVELPNKEIKFFASINMAADELNIPRTTMKRMAKGRVVKRYLGYQVTIVGIAYTELKDETLCN